MMFDKCYCVCVCHPGQDLGSQSEESRLQQSLCFSMYQGFVFSYESMLASQVRRVSPQTSFILKLQRSTVSVAAGHWVFTFNSGLGFSPGLSV